MTASASKPPRPSRALSAVELADNFRRQIIETTRRSMAMRRQRPEGICRWRRAAQTGPNADLALVFFWKEGLPAEVEIWPYAKIERLASTITDEEIYAELRRRLCAPQDSEGEPA